jgi:hypothetical protein
LTPVKDAAGTSLSAIHNDDAIPSLLIDNESLLQQKQPSSPSSPKKEPLPPKNSDVPMIPVGLAPNTPTANTTVLQTTTITAPSPTYSSVLVPVVSPVPALYQRRKWQILGNKKRHPHSPFLFHLNHYRNMLFLDDPTQTSPITLVQEHLENLPHSQYLCTGMVDYLLQWSIQMKRNQQNIIASSLSLSLMEAYVQDSQLDMETTEYIHFCVVCSKVFEIEEGGNKYKVTRPMNNGYHDNVSVRLQVKYWFLVVS